jgi:hypothetical protein
LPFINSWSPKFVCLFLLLLNEIILLIQWYFILLPSDKLCHFLRNLDERIGVYVILFLGQSFCLWHLMNLLFLRNIHGYWLSQMCRTLLLNTSILDRDRSRYGWNTVKCLLMLLIFMRSLNSLRCQMGLLCNLLILIDHLLIEMIISFRTLMPLILLIIIR